MNLEEEYINPRLKLLHKVKIAIIFIVCCYGAMWLYSISTNKTINSRQFYCNNESVCNQKECYPIDSSIDIIATNNNLEVTEVKITKCDQLFVQDLVKYYKNLKHLDISNSNYNNLDMLKLSSPRLLKLNVSYNKVNEIPLQFFINVPELIEIDISHNNLSDIASHTFNGTQKLKTIHLAYNSIDKINSKSLSSNKNLEYLDISNNLIEFFSDRMFDNNKLLKELHLENNTFGDLIEIPNSTSVYVS